LELGPDLKGLTCTREGCDRRYHLQLDHIDPHAHGGATSFANLQGLCGPDHWDKTQRDRQAGLLHDNRKERAP
jgi:5-methylcytosine-specific restriction endonuclease McrA